jgi:putative transposase
VRQEFTKNGEWIRYHELDKMLQKSEPYKTLKSQPSQCTLQMLDRSWSSYFEGIKEWEADKEKFLGKPNLPGYKPKNGRYPWFIKNNSSYIQDGILHFRLKRLDGIVFATRAKGRLICVRFIPRGSCYVMEIVTEVEIAGKKHCPMSRIAGIDLGINNFVTITNNIGARPIIINGKGLKSINQFYNKRRAQIQGYLKYRNGRYNSRALDDLYFKRSCRIKNFMHAASRKVVTFCIKNEIDTLVCGLNKGWKQEVNTGKENNQRFYSIPYNMFIKQMSYKCQESGIRFLTHEESFTSGTSFLDEEMPTRAFYNKSRRIQRGLFQSGMGLVNADVNAGMQIIKKVFPNAFESYGIEVDLQPVMLNVA